MPTSVELSPDYYLTNFNALVEFVMARYQPLLSEEEQQFHRRLEALEINSRRLYVRLLMRKGVPSSIGALFRQRKLTYTEIEDLPQAADQLVAAGLLRRNPQLPLKDYLPLFSRAELRNFSPSPLPRTLKRQALIEALLKQNTQEAELLDRLLTSGPVLALQSAEHFRTFRLLFFGNLKQDLTDYVLRDLGVYRYENYPLEQQHLPFHSRVQIEQHLSYYECLEQVEGAREAGREAILDLANRLPSGIEGDFTLDRRLERLRLSLARQLERLGALEDADHLYRLCSSPPARERRARIAVKRGDIDTGLALCREILAAPRNEVERLFAEGFAYRTAKKMRHADHWKAPVKYQPPTQTVTLPPAPERVELLAAAYLERAWSNKKADRCYYVENTLFNAILGLYIWDIVFSPVPGAFFNPFQTEPSDFRTADFYPSRRSDLERRLAEVDSDKLTQRVWQHYREKRNIANPLVAWDALSEDLLHLALTRIPPRHWQQLFRRQLSDIAHHCSGLPDLILFPNAGGYELVEVKGPGDRLQENQLHWLMYFAQHGIPHRLLHVEWQQS